jgi:lipopolysaccharide export system protein LptA
MWRTRPVLLLAIVALVGLVGSSYYSRVQKRAGHAASVPAALPENTAATAHRWSWTNTVKGRPTTTISAGNMRQVRQPNRFALDDVELRIFDKEGDKYNLVKCAKADFDTATEEMFSDGEVEITMNVPKDAPPAGKLLSIHSSGIHFLTKTGKALTDRAVSFSFDRGEGVAVGAEYDPQTRELHLMSQIHLTWRGSNPKAPPMNIEAGDVRYRESESKVYLSPWTKMTRDTLSMQGGATVVSLDQGAISKVESENAKGTEKQAARTLDFAADHMVMNFDDGQVNRISGQQNARLVSRTANGETRVTTDHIDMDFDVVRKGEHSESVLKQALASGNSVVESHPVASPGHPAQNRILKSDFIAMTMRAGGDELESVETRSPGSLEFVPTVASQSHRYLTGERMWITYGAHNQIQSFRAVNVTTRTENPKHANAKQPPPPVLTWSKSLNAAFDPKTNDLAHLEQGDQFRYESGDRRATANRADLDQVKNVIRLEGAARVWDSTGSTTATNIVMNQKDGSMIADGDVNSTRLPDKKAQPSGMLSADEPVHARARHMESQDNSRRIRYEGNAVAWQGGDRLQADVIEIDRTKNTLHARDNVVSELLDRADDEKTRAGKKKDQAPVFTVVHAAEMIYTDKDHVARYTGGATLRRPNLTVKGEEVIAYLRNENAKADGSKPDPAATAAAPAKNDSGSSLDHAVASGNVNIVSVSPLRTRTATSEYAEYFEDEGKVILTKGNPQLVDSIRGTTRGAELTWFSKNDRLLVNGAEKDLAHSLIRRTSRQ